MYHIFQRIALEKAIGTAIYFSYSFRPFHFAVVYYLGEEMEFPERFYYGKYHLLGQKIAISAVLLLQAMKLLPDSLTLSFASDQILIPTDAGRMDTFVSASSEPALGQGLCGYGKLVKELFRAAGWSIEELYVDFSFCQEDIWDDIEESEREQFFSWFAEVYAASNGEYEECFLWKFHTDRSYSYQELFHIFDDMVRYSNTYFAFLPDGSTSVYIFGNESEEYDNTIYDTCDLSSIGILSPLTALYYAGRLNPDFLLEDFTRRKEVSFLAS